MKEFDNEEKYFIVDGQLALDDLIYKNNIKELINAGFSNEDAKLLSFKYFLKNMTLNDYRNPLPSLN